MIGTPVWGFADQAALPFHARKRMPGNVPAARDEGSPDIFSPFK